MKRQTDGRTDRVQRLIQPSMNDRETPLKASKQWLIGARPEGCYDMQPSRMITDYRLSEKLSTSTDENNVLDDKLR